MSRIAISRRRLAMSGALAATVAAIVAAPLAGAATTTAAASPIPGDAPRDGCYTLADAKGDSTEASDDIQSLVMRSTDTSLIGYIKLYALAASGNGPLDDGNHFGWSITLNGHDIQADAAQTGPVAGLVRTVLGQSNTTARIDGADHADLLATSVFDQKNNTVIISINRAALEKDTKGSVADGTYLQNLNAESGPVLIVGLGQTDDTVSDPNPVLSDAYVVGHNPCFGPAPARVQITGDVSAPTQAVAHLGARILNADDTVDAGRLVKFSIGSATTSARTDGNGVASADLKIPMSPGFYSLTIYFPGDDKANETNYVTQFVVHYRETHMKLAYVDVSHGRRFTVTLLDASNQPVSGQTIAWSVKGVSKAKLTTNAAGRSVFTDTSSSREVLATYAGQPNSVSGCSAEFKY